MLQGGWTSPGVLQGPWSSPAPWSKAWSSPGNISSVPGDLQELGAQFSREGFPELQGAWSSPGTWSYCLENSRLFSRGAGELQGRSSVPGAKKPSRSIYTYRTVWNLSELNCLFSRVLLGVVSFGRAGSCIDKSCIAKLNFEQHSTAF